MIKVTLQSEASSVRFTFRLLQTHRERLIGLLGFCCSSEAVAFMRCRSIHTFGMRQNIDVAFMSQYGEVLASFRNVLPGKVLSCPQAYSTFERYSDAGAWFNVGEHYFISDVCVSAAQRRNSKRKGEEYELPSQNMSKMRRRTFPRYGSLLRLSVRFLQKEAFEE